MNNKFYSFDGSTWTEATNTPQNGGNPNVSSYAGQIGDTIYHSVYFDGTTTFYSFDGSSWTVINDLPTWSVNGSDAIFAYPNSDNYIGQIANKLYYHMYNSSSSLLICSYIKR